MEVRIRNVDPSVVKVIDDYAKSHGESRNQYLKRLLLFDAKRKILAEAKFETEKIIAPLTQALERIFYKLDEHEQDIQKILALLIYIGEIEQEEVNQLLDETIYKIEED